MLDRLEHGIESCNNLEELINCFFDILGDVDGEIEYVAGTLPAIYMQPGCKFILSHSIELEDGEYNQTEMHVELDAGEEKYPYEHKIYDKNDGDLKEYILSSDLYTILKNKKVINVEVFGGET